MASSKRSDVYLFRYVEVREGKDRSFKGQVVDSHNGFLYVHDGEKTITVRRKDVDFVTQPTSPAHRVVKTDAPVVKAFRDCMVETPTLSAQERKGIFGLMLLLADSQNTS